MKNGKDGDCMGYRQFQDEMKRLYEEEGLSLTEIDKRYGTSKGTVKNVLKDVVEFRPQSAFDAFADEWYDLYVNQGWTKADIARKHNTYTSTVSNVLRKKGILPERQKKPRKYDDLLPDFIKEYKKGMSLNEIAVKHDVDIKIVHTYLLNEGIELRTITEATRQYPINETYFNVLDSDPKAYHLGIVFGKGFLTKNVFSSFLDVSIHQKRKHLIQSLVEALQHENEEKINKENVTHRFISVPLYETLSHYGLHDNNIRNIPSERLEAFWKGYLSIKLYVTEKREWRVKDKKLILDSLKDWLSEKVSGSSIFIRKEEDFFSLYIYQQAVVEYLNHWLNQKEDL
jgi:hypothetical protein